MCQYVNNFHFSVCENMNIYIQKLQLKMQPGLINLRINTTSLHYPIACNAYANVQFCMHMTRKSFPLTLVEGRCAWIPRGIFGSSDVTREAQFTRFTWCTYSFKQVRTPIFLCKDVKKIYFQFYFICLYTLWATAVHYKSSPWLCIFSHDCILKIAGLLCCYPGNTGSLYPHHTWQITFRAAMTTRSWGQIL